MLRCAFCSEPVVYGEGACWRARCRQRIDPAFIALGREHWANVAAYLVGTIASWKRRFRATREPVALTMACRYESRRTLIRRLLEDA